MKTLYCLLISLITYLFPTEKMKQYCNNLADKTYIITENNKE